MLTDPLVIFVYGQLVLGCFGTQFLPSLSEQQQNVELHHMQNLIDQERVQVLDLQGNLTSLTSDFHSLENVFSAENNRVKALQVEVLNNTRFLANEKDKIGKLEKNASDCRKAILNLRQSAEASIWISGQAIKEHNQNPVAFSVGFTTNQEHNRFQSILVFNHIFVNYGNAYKASTGIFTAPVSGTFRFSLTVLMRNANEHLAFFVNGNKMQSVFTFLKNNLGRGEMAVIYNLHAGDKLWVGYANETYTPSIIESKGTMLIGHLLN